MRELATPEPNMKKRIARPRWNSGLGSRRKTTKAMKA
jgi:hypothetical protein